jgi:hypothetical protein
MVVDVLLSFYKNSKCILDLMFCPQMFQSYHQSFLGVHVIIVETNFLSV